MKYKKKPVVVEAIRFNGYVDPMFSERPPWLEQAIKDGTLYLHESIGKLGIKTLEGPMVASKGDYIIQGIHKEIYACKPNVFEQTYVPEINTTIHRPWQLDMDPELVKAVVDRESNPQNTPVTKKQLDEAFKAIASNPEVKKALKKLGEE